MKNLDTNLSDASADVTRDAKRAAVREEIARRLSKAIAERAAGVEIVPVDDDVHREGMRFLHDLAAVPTSVGVCAVCGHRCGPTCGSSSRP